MSDQIETADVFDLPVYENEFRYANDGDAYSEAAAHAVNNHDRLTAENEALREENKRLLFANRYNTDMYEQMNDARKAAEQERDQLKGMLSKITDSGTWYISALELDEQVDGEELGREIEQLLSVRNQTKELQ